MEQNARFSLRLVQIRRLESPTQDHVTGAPVQNPAYVLLPGLFLGLSLGLGLDKQTNAGKKKSGKHTAITRQSHAVTCEGRQGIRF
jgi:hypothetical protein